jgi:hypothetical protein
LFEGEIMKTIVFALLGLAVLTEPAVARGSHAVKAHVTKNGTYVAPTVATNPDKTQLNNFSAKGNFNPVTGKEGTKEPKK